jgi:hypothetical protein
MKKLLVILVLTCCIGSAMAQHYGGVTFTPGVLQAIFSKKTFGPYESSEAVNASSFGYTIGYQGLLMPKKRFSFLYGIQYTDFYYECNIDPPIGFTTYNPPNPSTDVMSDRFRQDFEAIQLPLWWRYNFLKNKEKWQPFVAISTTVTFPLKEHFTYYSIDGDPMTNDSGFGIGLSLDVGAGVNYYLDKWCFSGQVTYSASYMSRIGLGISVLRKF